MQRQERLKQNKLTYKSQVDDMEAEINEVRKRLTVQQKEIAGVQKNINQMEVKLEQRRADRHSLLKSCKVRLGLLIPFIHYSSSRMLYLNIL